jgi:signal transduction histidine kinase
MAGTPVASLSADFVSSIASRAHDGERRPGGHAIRWLQAAAMFHVGVIVLALLELIFLPPLVLLVTGLVVTLLALRVPLLSAVSAERRAVRASNSGTADLSPAKKGSGDSPAPLPFIGERIAFNPDTAQLEGLARAAARLKRMPTARSHPWGDLIARVSHELRTPLNAVIGFSDVMKDELLGPVGHPRYREYAQHICDSGRSLLKSAEDTLAITYLLDHDPEARLEAGVDLAPIVADAWAFHAAGSTGLSLEADLPDRLDVLVDRRPLRQIFINLFAEAVRRADARGTVGCVATVDGDLVQIEVFLRGRPDSASVGQASLPICLARALLELNGASLIEVDHASSTWRALTVLPCAAQNDFFLAPSVAAAVPERAMHVC